MNIEWAYKRLYWKVRMYLNTHLGWKIRRRYYNGKRIYDTERMNDRLAERIRSGEAFCAARLGGSEIRGMVACQPEQKKEQPRIDTHNILINLSGFFGSLEDFERYNHLMERSLGAVDLLGVWYNQMEDYLCKRYGKAELEYGLLMGMEPWYTPAHPWTAALAGKRVVVIHPFAESIYKQYERREAIFPGTELLPEFSLRVVKAVQTIAAQEDHRFASWFEALDYMYAEAMREEFDIALIACGAYGLPLAARLREAGKQSVHMGGSLQLLFGIMGARWEKMPELEPYVSDAWVRPLPSERLEDGRNAVVENECYW